MIRNNPLGTFEELVLLATLTLGDNAYGVTIRQRIADATGEPVSIGAVYTTLERLHYKGFVTSHVGQATPERGGRAKRFFKVHAAGIMVLQSMTAKRGRLTEGTGLDWSVT